MKNVLRVGVGIVLAASVSLGSIPVSAEQYTGTSYKLNGNLGTSTGETGNSESYVLESTSGESIVGNAAGGSYKMFQGYITDTTPMMRLSVDLSGLVASYPLNETTGKYTYDYSSYRAYGTQVNTPTAVAGKLSGAVTFNGSSQAIVVGNTTQTQLSSAGTLEAWVKTSTSSGAMAAVAKTSNFWLGVNNGNPALYDWTSATTCADTTTTISDGNWHHVAVTLNSGVSNGSTIYVDGVAKKTCTWTPLSQSGSLVLGAQSNGGSAYSQYFNGSIDHVKIFNRLLGVAEIQAEYAAQNTGNGTGLTLGQITPGISSVTDIAAIVATNSNDYSLLVSQDHDLQQASYTIPAISALVTSPSSWAEGTTKGLGFTLMSGPSLDGKWASGANYAALPNSATTFYTRTDMSVGSDDVINMRLRADAVLTQQIGDYSNVMTITGTAIP